MKVAEVVPSAALGSLPTVAPVALPMELPSVLAALTAYFITASVGLTATATALRRAASPLLPAGAGLLDWLTTIIELLRNSWTWTSFPSSILHLSTILTRLCIGCCDLKSCEALMSCQTSKANPPSLSFSFLDFYGFLPSFLGMSTFMGFSSFFRDTVP